MNVEVLGDDIDYGMDFSPYSTMLGTDLASVPMANATMVGPPAPVKTSWLSNLGQSIATGTKNFLNMDTAGTSVASRLANLGINAATSRLTPTDKANLALFDQNQQPSFFEQYKTPIIIAGAVGVGLVVILATRRKKSRR